ncbi:MAG TPA: hypothetical protein VD995_04505 [Azospirillum sp.]|nr:hypothetical protein [Azospirillum sp.]
MSLQTRPQPDQIRLQRIAEHLVGLGPRAIAEALSEALSFGDLDRLEAYRRLCPDMVQAVSGVSGSFPPQFVETPVDLCTPITFEDGIGREVA